MLVVTTNDLEKLHKALTEMDDRALPYAVKESLNTSAFAAKREWEVQGRKMMTIRTSWAFRHRLPAARGGGLGHAVVKARIRRSIHQMQAVAGNTHKFMDMQEHGFMKFDPRGVQRPTKKSRIAQSYDRLVQRAHYRKAKKGRGIKLPPESKRYRYSKGTFGSKKRFIAAQLRAARSSGATHIMLDLGKTNKGIYDIRKKQMRKVWDMSRRSLGVKPSPMLRRTIKHLEPAFPTYHRSALERQIRFVLKKRGFRPRGANVLAEAARFQSLQQGD